MRTYKQTLVIAAITSRPYVEAAVTAGYEVIAVDCFVDADTKRLAKSTHQIDLQDGQLNAEQVLATVLALNLKNVAGFCYGAGFEMQIEALSVIARHIKVFGNTADVVKRCKDPRQFFQTCDNLGVPFPKVIMQRPVSVDGWLQKTIGGSGGAHIKTTLKTACNDIAGVYFQRHQEGLAISCLFLADENGVQVIGFNEQWPGSRTFELFRYGGAVNNADISMLAKTRLSDYVSKLANSLQLRGLNSCDAICNGDEVFVLEVNPRLSASLDLYPSEQGDLMAAHITGQPIVSKSCETSTAHQVVYARQDMTIKPAIIWPVWVKDKPEVGERFTNGMPICTVTAEAKVASQAKALVKDRVSVLSSEFLN